MSRPPLHRPILLPGLPRIWRGLNTLQLGLHPSRAVLLDLPDPATAKILDLLDGTRPERTVLQGAAMLGISPAEARTLLNVLHEAGLVISSQSLFPPALDAQTRRLLASEAAALALIAQAILTARVVQPTDAERTGRAGTPAQQPALMPEQQDQPAHNASNASAAPATPARSTDSADRTPTAEPISYAAAAQTTAKAQPSGVPRPRRGGGSADTEPEETGDRPLSPAAVLRRRRSARVAITGRGRLGAGIAVALAEAGVGHIHADLPGTVNHLDRIGGPLRGVKEGTGRARAVTEAIREVSPTTQTRSIRRGSASLVVQLTHDEPTALLALAHEQHRQPYLAVAVREGAAVIGPLVPAGGQPCLNCLALFRHLGGPGIPEQNRNPSYPDADPEPGEFGTLEVLHSAPRYEDLRVNDEPLAVATALTACGYAVAQVLSFIDGDTPETVGAEVEIAAPNRIRRRRWVPHPHCTCGQTRNYA
ncbi:hypothetical protein [Actinoplanes sp. NPDC051494]|uniref:hypothetical protein n=1 Tax=Actinoplanes sp. NPDC051494 TaxID=3363907 RepID=UPI0037B2AE2E